MHIQPRKDKTAYLEQAAFFSWCIEPQRDIRKKVALLFDEAHTTLLTPILDKLYKLSIRSTYNASPGMFNSP